MNKKYCNLIAWFNRSPINESISRILIQLGFGDFLNPSSFTNKDDFEVETKVDIDNFTPEDSLPMEDVLNYLEIKKEDIEEDKEDENDDEYKPNLETSYSCDLCEYSSKCLRGLKLHKETSHENTKYTCIICNHEFKSKYGLKSHSKRKHGLKTFKCDRCEFKGDTFKQLIKHRGTHKDKLTCDLCDFSSLSLADFSR